MGVVHFNDNPFIKIDKNFEYGSVLCVFTHDGGLKQVCGPLKEYRHVLRDIHLNPDSDIYSYFSHHCGNQLLEIHKDLCTYVKGNRKIVQEFAKEYLKVKGITLDESLRRNNSHTCTELIICLLCQLYKLRCAIITLDEVWMTSENVGFFEYDMYLGWLNIGSYIMYTKRITILPEVWKYTDIAKHQKTMSSERFKYSWKIRNTVSHYYASKKRTTAREDLLNTYMLCSLNGLSLLQSCRRPAVKQIPNAGYYDWQSSDYGDMSDEYPSDTEYNPYYDDNEYPSDTEYNPYYDDKNYPFRLSDSDLYSDDVNDEQQQPLNLCTVNNVMNDVLNVESKTAGDVDERETADILHSLDSPSTSVVGGLENDHKVISSDTGDSGDKSEVVESAHDLENHHKVISSDTGDSGDKSEVVESTHDLENDCKVISPDTGDSGDKSEVVESACDLKNDHKVISLDTEDSGDKNEVVESARDLENDCKVILHEANNKDTVPSAESQDM